MTLCPLYLTYFYPRFVPMESYWPQHELQTCSTMTNNLRVAHVMFPYLSLGGISILIIVTLAQAIEGSGLALLCLNRPPCPDDRLAPFPL